MARAETAVGSPKASEDAFLGGRLRMAQPLRGHRAGLDAVLLAAAVPAAAGETVLDMGAGVGVAGACVLARCPGAAAVLVESDPALAALARDNGVRNGMADRMRIVAADIARPSAAARAEVGTVAHALANPPFHDPSRARISPHKALAHAAPPACLDDWVRFAASAVAPGGTLTMIHRADALALVVAAFGGRFGGARVLPVHPRPGLAATRVLVQGVKGSRAALSILPGLVLHGGRGGAFLPAVDEILRGAAALPLAAPRRGRHLAAEEEAGTRGR